MAWAPPSSAAETGQQLRQVLGFLDAPAEQRDYSAINDALAQMDADGTLSRLSVKYFGMDISKEQ